MAEIGGLLLAIWLFCLLMLVLFVVAAVIGGFCYWLIWRFIRWGVSYPRRR